MSTERPHPLVASSKRLSGSLIWSIPLSMLGGLFAGLLTDASPLAVLVLPLTMLMVYPMLVNVRLAEAFHFRGGKPVLVAMALNFLVFPLLAWGLARLFFSADPGLFVGMVLVGIFPTSGMTISWTGLARGNVGAAVRMTVIGLLAASLLAPVYLKVLAGAVVEVDILGVLTTVGLVVAIPLVAAQLTRLRLVAAYGKERFSKRIAPMFPGISALGVLGIVFIAVALKATMIVERPILTLLILGPLVLFYAVGFAISTMSGKALLPRGDAIALVYGTVMRNLSIALGVAMASFGPEAALVLAAAYVVQVQAAAWYVRLTGRLFGLPEQLGATGR